MFFANVKASFQLSCASIIKFQSATQTILKRENTLESA